MGGDKKEKKDKKKEKKEKEPPKKQKKQPEPEPEEEKYVAPTEAELRILDEEDLKGCIITERQMKQDGDRRRGVLRAKRDGLEADEKLLQRKFREVARELEKLELQMQLLDSERELLQSTHDSTIERSQEDFATRVADAERSQNLNQNKWYMESCALREDDVIAQNKHLVKEEGLLTEYQTAAGRATTAKRKAAEVQLQSIRMRKETDLQEDEFRRMMKQAKEQRQRVGGAFMAAAQAAVPSSYPPPPAPLPAGPPMSAPAPPPPPPRQPPPAAAAVVLPPSVVHPPPAPSPPRISGGRQRRKDERGILKDLHRAVFSDPMQQHASTATGATVGFSMRSLSASPRRSARSGFTEKRTLTVHHSGATARTGQHWSDDL
eukprot:TRINITY_DN7908_c0_g1_i1.p1 TRINITY_DN7908_c0_g1~~TRINITY_DN7908_c0_g1_i1.p1  ORF type:complete len:377 (+),score=156.50 TRINITY_DN7908_c0_g1_i1:106-1236(+)